MNISLMESIINTNTKDYIIANVEAGKKYKINFDIDGHFQIQFAQKKTGSAITKPITRNLRGIVAHYSYNVPVSVTGELVLVDLSHILPGNVEWKTITNLTVEEI